MRFVHRNFVLLLFSSANVCFSGPKGRTVIKISVRKISTRRQKEHLVRVCHNLVDFQRNKAKAGILLVKESDLPWRRSWFLSTPGAKLQSGFKELRTRRQDVSRGVTARKWVVRLIGHT